MVSFRPGTVALNFFTAKQSLYFIVILRMSDYLFRDDGRHGRRIFVIGDDSAVIGLSKVDVVEILIHIPGIRIMTDQLAVLERAFLIRTGNRIFRGYQRHDIRILNIEGPGQIIDDILLIQQDQIVCAGKVGAVIGNQAADIGIEIVIGSHAEVDGLRVNVIPVETVFILRIQRQRPLGVIILFSENEGDAVRICAAYRRL